MRILKTIKILGMTTISLLAFMSLAFANPAMLPAHPGHPMKPLKDPILGQSLANDAGRSPLYEEKALEKSTEEANEDFKILSDAAKEKKMKREKEKQAK